MSKWFAKSLPSLKVSLGREKSMDGLARPVVGSPLVKGAGHVGTLMAGRPISPLSHPVKTRTV